MDRVAFRIKNKHVEFDHICLDDTSVYGTLPNPSWQHHVYETGLSVRPSIHCLRCGLHGHITDGKWVPIA